MDRIVVVDFPLHHGTNRSPGTLGAATVSMIAALLTSAGEGGREVPLVGAPS